MIRRLLGVFSTQLATQAIAFVAGILAARLLGPEERGWFAVATVIPMFVASATDLGLRAVLLYHLPRAAGDPARVGEILTMALRFALVTLLLMGIVYLLLAGWPELRGRIALPIHLVAASAIFCLLTYAFGIFTVVFEGLGDFRPRNFLQLLPPLGVVAACAMATSAGLRWGARQLVAVNCVGLGAGILVAAVVLRKRHAFALTRRWPEGWRKRFLGFGLASAPGMVATHLNSRADTLVLTSLRGAEQTGLYSVATSISEWPIMAIQSLTTVLLPGIGAAGERDRDRLALLGLGGGLLFTALSAGGLALVVGWLTPLLYGDSFSGSVAPALVLLQGSPGLTVTRVSGTISVAHGRPGLRTGAALIGLAATIALDLLWIPKHGAVGAAWASLCSYLLSAAVAVFWLAPLLHRSPGRLMTDSIGTTVREALSRFAPRAPSSPS